MSCHRSQFADGGEWARRAVRDRCPGGRTSGRGGLCRGFPTPAARWLTRAPRAPGARGVHRAARRHGLVLRLGRGPRRPFSGGAARHRRGRRGRGGWWRRARTRPAAFGIHSAMPSIEARRRCPHAVFLPGRFARYMEMSERLHAVLQRFSPVVEGISLDEAFVDVAGAAPTARCPARRGRRIHEAVRDRPAYGMRRGGGPDEAARQAGVARRQAGARPRRPPARSRRLRGPPRGRARLPPPPAGAGPVGRGPGHGAADSRASA